MTPNYRIKGMAYRKGSDPKVDAHEIVLPAPNHLVHFKSGALAGMMDVGSGVMALDDDGNIFVRGEIAASMAPQVQMRRYFEVNFVPLAPGKLRALEIVLIPRSNDRELPPWEIDHG